MYPRSDGELENFYRQTLSQDILPFWRRAWDTESGGVFTCFSNDGSRLLGTDKFVWSQGRFLWLLSRYIRMIDAGLIDDTAGTREVYFAQARLTCRFLLDNAVLDPEDGVCPFLLTREGEKKESIPGKGFYTSFYVDCFVILGLSEFSQASEDPALLERALELYDRTRAYQAVHGVVSEPYPFPPGFLSHSVPMIFCDVTYGLSEALGRFGHSRHRNLRAECLQYAKTILTVHYDEENGLLREMVPIDSRDEDTLVARHLNPGHAIESMWFCGRVLEKTPDNKLFRDRITRVVRNSIAAGWDSRYGGILRFCDRDGGAPEGRLLSCPYERQLTETWNTKLWWVHSEALYSTLYCLNMSEEPRFRELHWQLGQYVFSTFPNPDQNVGEWIQIRDRSGLPLDKVVALPVKDPYHIVRNFLLSIELLSGTVL